MPATYIKPYLHFCVIFRNKQKRRCRVTEVISKFVRICILLYDSWKIRIWGIYTTNGATHQLHRLGLELGKFTTFRLAPQEPQPRSRPARAAQPLRTWQLTGPDLRCPVDLTPTLNFISIVLQMFKDFMQFDQKSVVKVKSGPCLTKAELALSTSKRKPESPYLVLSFFMCKNGCNNCFSSPTGLFWGATVTSDHISYCWSPVHTTRPLCLVAGPIRSIHPLKDLSACGSLECASLDAHSLSSLPWGYCSHVPIWERLSWTTQNKSDSRPDPHFFTCPVL